MSKFEPPSRGFLGTRGRVSTLGMFIIDQFAVRDEQGNVKPSEEESIGGGGIFAMTAARIFLPPTSCALLVDKGPDFPTGMARNLEELGEGMVWFRKREGKTTRALNIYSGGKIGEGHQSFEYLTPRLNLLPHDLIAPPSPFAGPGQHLPEYIHVVTNTQRARLVVDEMDAIRQHGLGGLGLPEGPGMSAVVEHERGKGWDAKLIWEPMPSCCNPSEFETILDLAPSFQVISPNLLELQSILSITPQQTPTRREAEQAALKFHDFLEAKNTTISATEPIPARRGIPSIIVRAGELGTYTLSEEWRGWVPAYWREDEQNHVVDVTGGGNAFLGGLCAGLLISNGNIRAASIYGSTTASFVIQQKGLPKLAQSRNGETEKWNGVDPWERLLEMAGRLE
ncbi:hypothetical protein IAU59_000981 [Kwoniella sp. CBS 9459]